MVLVHACSQLCDNTTLVRMSAFALLLMLMRISQVCTRLKIFEHRMTYRQFPLKAIGASEMMFDFQINWLTHLHFVVNVIGLSVIDTMNKKSWVGSQSHVNVYHIYLSSGQTEMQVDASEWKFYKRPLNCVLLGQQLAWTSVGLHQLWTGAQIWTQVDANSFPIDLTTQACHTSKQVRGQTKRKLSKVCTGLHPLWTARPFGQGFVL